MNAGDPTARMETPALSQVDPELLALPAPPRGLRFSAMSVMVLVTVASAALLASLRHDVRYFFASPEVVSLGEAASLETARIEPNSYVHVRGTPMASATVRYTRVIGGTTYSVFPLAGQRAIFVQVPTTDDEANGSFARGEFAGRIVTFGQLGARFRPVRDYLGTVMGLPVSAESFVLLADERPDTHGWALALAMLCMGFIGINVAMFVRWFRPLR